MKKLLIFGIIASTIIFLHIILVCAQRNYIQAIEQAKATDGSDASIEQALYEHGFKIDAYDMNEPTLYTKIQALFTSTPNNNINTQYDYNINIHYDTVFIYDGNDNLIIKGDIDSITHYILNDNL